MRKKLSSVQDVDRCVDEKQNSDSGSVGKPPSPHVEGKLAASETDDGQTGLLPCPCCGFPPQVLEDYKCFGFGVAGWQIRCDKCGLQTCWWHSLKEAISHWNTRASDTSNAPTQDTESGVSPAVSVDAVAGSLPHQSNSESSPSTSVSEAAPERIWIQKDTSFFQATGNGTYYRDPDKNSIEYARVHQPPQMTDETFLKKAREEDSQPIAAGCPEETHCPACGSTDLGILSEDARRKYCRDCTTTWNPSVLLLGIGSHQPPEQNLEDKNLVSGASDYSTSRIPKDILSDAAASTGAWIKANPHASARDACAELIRRIEARLPMPRERPSTSDVLGNPNRGISSRNEPESSESESTLVTVDEAVRRAAEKIGIKIAPHLSCEVSLIAFEKGFAEIITAELSVHQPDVHPERLHIALHKLWTKAVGQEGYVKAEWRELDDAIFAALAASPVQPEVSNNERQ